MLYKAAIRKVLSASLSRWCIAASTLMLSVQATAQVNVTETFDVGAGTRFNAFVSNDVVRPKPATMTDPPDADIVHDAFGGTRTVVENGNIITNHFGFTSTNFAGGLGAGEFGGEFNWFDYGGVADTNLGGELNHSQEVVIKAKMLIKDVGGSNDERITLGYYNLPATPVASDFSRGNISAGIGFVGGPRFVLQINGNNSGAINVPADEPFDIDLTLKFDSGAGEAWFEGQVAGIPIGQFTFSQAADALHPFDAFAISQSFLRESQDAWRRGVAFIDDLSYSVVSDQGIDTPSPPRIDEGGGTGVAGDFDGDGGVDGDDLVIWKTGFGMATGANVMDGDSDADGDVDGGDFLIWQRQLGASGAAINGVPEPSTIFSSVLGGGLPLLHSIRRRRNSAVADTSGYGRT